MRLWHKDLIPYLPDLQLKGQWRECALISDALAKNGTPNHILVNRVTEYSPHSFGQYCLRVKREMEKRGFPVKDGHMFGAENAETGEIVPTKLLQEEHHA